MVFLLFIITGIGWFLSSSSSFGLNPPSLTTSSPKLLELVAEKEGPDSPEDPENPKAAQMVGQLEVWDPRIPVVNQPWWVLELHCGYTSSSHQ